MPNEMETKMQTVRVRLPQSDIDTIKKICGVVRFDSVINPFGTAVFFDHKLIGELGFGNLTFEERAALSNAFASLIEDIRNP